MATLKILFSVFYNLESPPTTSLPTTLIPREKEFGQGWNQMKFLSHHKPLLFLNAIASLAPTTTILYTRCQKSWSGN